MTSQVAIINQNSVCLASDSAVMYSPGTVFNSAEKIYQLAGRQPVGYMAYNAGVFMGHSWDRIFGLYRRKIADDGEKSGSKEEQKYGRMEFDYLWHDEGEEENSEGASDYVGHLLKFLADCDDLSNEKIEITSMADEIFRYMKANIRSLRMAIKSLEMPYHKSLQEEGGAFIDAVGNLLREQTQVFAYQEFERVTSEEFYRVGEENWEEMKNQFLESLRDEFLADDAGPEVAKELSELIGRNIGQSGIVDDGDLLSICNLYLHSIGEDPMFGTEYTGNYTGLVVGGFGKNQTYPDLVKIKIRPKWKGMRVSVDRLMQPGITPLAQSERIQAVVQSLGSATEFQLKETISEELHDSFLPFLVENTPGVGEKTLELMQDKVRGSGWQFSEFTIDKLRGLREGQGESIGPEQINRLSTLDMASLAEKLVDMEATFQYVTQAIGAGVGGSVDVVTITKEDGLVWVKRKDVIDEQLNPRIYKSPRPEARHV